MRNLLLLVLSVAIATLVGEFALRLALDEVNYLRPTLRDDSVLGYVIAPGSAGHDEWGFRNRRVPDTADIVAIGDSQTYGVSAPANKAWPAQLEETAGMSVYNMALGGYGPVGYVRLLETKATNLGPRTILVGLYMGNDIFDSYQSSFDAVWPDTADRDTLTRKLRDWLSTHSLTYQVVKYEFDAIVDVIRYKEATLEGQYRFDHPALRTVFTPGLRFSVLDQDVARNREGLEITLRMLAQIGARCAEHSYDCLVIIIPTKESVYWPMAEKTLTGEAR